MNDQTKRNSFARNQLPAIAWALLIFGLSSIPGPSMPVLPFQVSDKIEHATVFFCFCFFLYRALRNQQRYPWLSAHSLTISLALTAIYGALDETHQMFVPGRDPDVFDFLADSLGGAVFAGLLLLLHLRKPKKQS